MLTKRMMLGVGALALALAVAACSEDRAGGATGVAEAPSMPVEDSPAPLAAAPERVRPDPEGGTGGGLATVISSSIYDGHHVVLSEVTTSTGAKLTRVLLDGQVLMDVQGILGDLSPGEMANASFYSDGVLVMQDQLLMGTAPTTVMRPAGGPQAAQVLPCMDELAAFGAASLALSFRLYIVRYAPTYGNWAMAAGAGVAVLYTGYALYACLHAHW